MTSAPPKVFISYSHDTGEHQERVLVFANRLRADGIDAEIDQYNAAPPEGWPLWCEQQIEAANFVLMVCTKIYYRRVKGDEQRGQGLGVVWEAKIIRQLLYDAGGVSAKFVPVLFSDSLDEHVPTPVRGRTRYLIDTDDGYEGLLRQLSGQPSVVRPDLRPMRALPTRRGYRPALEGKERGAECQAGGLDAEPKQRPDEEEGRRRAGAKAQRAREGPGRERLELKKPAEYAVEIALVSNRENDRRLWLPRLRGWLDVNAPLLDKLCVKPEISSFNSIDAALCWRAELPNKRVVLVPRSSRIEIEHFRKSITSSGEPIILAEDPNPGSDNNPSATFFDDGEVIVIARDVTSQLRKSVIRAVLRQRVQIRPPTSDAELTGYFALRYIIWKSIGYLQDEHMQTAKELEIDFWDRTAVPLCAIAQDGRVVGCTRLISPFGDEQRYVHKIETFLHRINDSTLYDLFRYPHTPQPPFDILFEFPGFGPRFQELMRAKTKIAEIGRVIVDPLYRGTGLSEALVDTAASYAKRKSISLLFLACPEVLVKLYTRCGFVPVEGMQSSKFFKIQRASIIMQKQLSKLDN